MEICHINQSGGFQTRVDVWSAAEVVPDFLVGEEPVLPGSSEKKSASHEGSVKDRFAVVCGQHNCSRHVQHPSKYDSSSHLISLTATGNLETEILPTETG